MTGLGSVRIWRCRSSTFSRGTPSATDVAAVAADALVAARAERLGPCAGEQHHADRRVVARMGEGVLQLDDRLGPEGVAHLGPIDRDLGDALEVFVADVLEGAVQG